MITGIYSRRLDHMTGRFYFELVTRDSCWKCDRPSPDLAHAVYEYVAAVISEPLRQALDRHLDEHGCTQARGIAYCDEAVRLSRLLPEAEQVIIA